MIRFQHLSGRYAGYATRAGGARQSYAALPPWARSVLLVAAVPGILLLALSGVIFVLSMAALLALTLPAYALVARLAGPTAGRRRQGTVAPLGRRPARHVEATVID